MGLLVLVRHGLSTYNQKGWWTGWDNPELTSIGIDEAKRAGKELKDIHFTTAYVSVFKRAIDTLEEIKKEIKQKDLPTIVDKRINERNYGVYNGKNKWEIEKEIGEKNFLLLRRSWDYPIPEGESLKQVYEREIPFFKDTILKQVMEGNNVLVVSSGNALRAIVKYLEHIPDDKIAHLEISTGQVYVYKISSNGTIEDKDIRQAKKNTV